VSGAASVISINPSVLHRIIELIELNIQQDRNLLKITTDVWMHQTIAKWLAEEQIRLLKLSALANKQNDSGGNSHSGPKASFDRCGTSGKGR
jgi:hypothetical protein